MATRSEPPSSPEGIPRPLVREETVDHIANDVRLSAAKGVEGAGVFVRSRDEELVVGMVNTTPSEGRMGRGTQRQANGSIGAD